MAIVEDFVEVVLLDRIGVADDLRLQNNEPLHVAGDVRGEAGAEEAKCDLGNDRIALDNVKHRLLDKLVVALSLWHELIVRAIDREVQSSEESSCSVLVMLLDRFLIHLG